MRARREPEREAGSRVTLVTQPSRCLFTPNPGIRTTAFAVAHEWLVVARQRTDRGRIEDGSDQPGRHTGWKDRTRAGREPAAEH